MWLQQLLDRRQHETPQRIALRDSRRDVTWQRLHRDARALARALGAHVQAQDRVVVLSADRVEVLEAVFACALGATVAVPLNPALTNRELAGILETIAPGCAVADTTGADRLARLRPGLPVLGADEIADLPDGPVPDHAGTVTDPVLILHTSATTGFPKGVVTDQRYYQLQADSWQKAVGSGPDSTYLHTSPLCHGSITIALDYLAAGASVCVLEQFTPPKFLQAVQRWQIRDTFLVPTMIRLILESRHLPGADLTCLRLVAHGGAPCPPELADQAAAAFQADIRTIFGITEGGGPVLTLAPTDTPGPAPLVGATCAGHPMPGVHARISGPDKTVITDPHEVGTLQLNSQGLMRGYWNNPQATAQALTDGWLNTGDLACHDEAGRLWIVNRRTDLILRGGQNVYPAEIEHVLRGIDWVTEAVVVPAADPTAGQTPVAFVQPTRAGDFDEHQLVTHCITQLAGYKRPTRFIPLHELPRNTIGKLLRRPLQEQAEALTTDTTNPAPPPTAPEPASSDDKDETDEGME
ncbi:class I adenylate-forming enzyme family protein [Streptomyces sp. NPDC059525]|uniref:class I adenylate-forming enzyme family protein n=1 Tax=Streptomyces sp. NPDC059525 TaxID=3346857 RepID=UPI00367AC66F